MALQYSEDGSLQIQVKQTSICLTWLKKCVRTVVQML